jgi:hypothetical protein
MTKVINEHKIMVEYALFAVADGGRDESNVGAKNSSVKDMDEVCLIFDIESKGKQYARKNWEVTLSSTTNVV